MLDSASPTLGVALAVLSVPVAFVAGWLVHYLRAAGQSTDLQGKLDEQASFSREQLECLWQNLSDASAEVQQVRAEEQARQVEAEQRILAADQRAAALELFREELATELDAARRAHESAKAQLASRETEVEASAGLLDELQRQANTMRADLESRSRELETATLRIRELERVAGERQEQIASLRAGEAQALQLQGDLSVQVRARQDELDRALARAAIAENSTAALEPLRMRIASLESELGMTQRAHAELTGVLRERVASLEDTLAKSTSAFETLAKERSEAQLRDQRQQDELSSLRVELAVKAPLVDEIDVLRSELAKRDALLAELAAREAADARPPKPRRVRAKRKAAEETPASPVVGETVTSPSPRPSRRGELPSV